VATWARRLGLVNPVMVCTIAHKAPGQGHDPRVAEVQGWGPPTFHQGWSRDPLTGWAGKDTALADTQKH
jgi:hypothetical protein